MIVSKEHLTIKVDLLVWVAQENSIVVEHSMDRGAAVVMVNVADPVGSGFIKSLARPGGNITGLSNVSVEMSPKLLEMLLSMVPKLSRVAVLTNPSNSGHATMLKNVQTAAQKANVKVLPVEARNLQEIETAFSVMTKNNAGAIIVARDALLNQQLRQIVQLDAGIRRQTGFSSGPLANP